jgi:hypothetical protein
MMVTPYDLQDKAVLPANMKKEEKIDYAPKKVHNEYSTKFKAAIYAAILFILLSQNISYKILDLIVKLFTQRLEVIDEDNNPQIIGTIILALIIGLIIFLF